MPEQLVKPTPKTKSQEDLSPKSVPPKASPKSAIVKGTDYIFQKISVTDIFEFNFFSQSLYLLSNFSSASSSKVGNTKVSPKTRQAKKKTLANDEINTEADASLEGRIERIFIPYGKFLRDGNFGVYY